MAVKFMGINWYEFVDQKTGEVKKGCRLSFSDDYKAKNADHSCGAECFSCSRSADDALEGFDIRGPEDVALLAKFIGQPVAVEFDRKKENLVVGWNLDFRKSVPVSAPADPAAKKLGA